MNQISPIRPPTYADPCVCFLAKSARKPDAGNPLPEFILGFGIFGKKSRKKVYPMTPQIGTGTSKKMENRLCETVSQLMALEMAQKLR
jgi:hypothetical protein